MKAVVPITGILELNFNYDLFRFANNVAKLSMSTGLKSENPH